MEQLHIPGSVATLYKHVFVAGVLAVKVHGGSYSLHRRCASSMLETQQALR